MVTKGKKIEKFIVLCLVFLAVLCLSDRALALSEVKGVVEKIERSAWIVREGKRYDLKPGSQIREFDIVRTDRMGSLTVRFIDDTVMNLDKNSEALIIDINWTPKSARFNVGVNRGLARFKTGSIILKNHHGYNLTTPKSIINMQDSTVSIFVTPQEEKVRAEEIRETCIVSVVNKKTLEALDITAPQQEVSTNALNAMSYSDGSENTANPEG